MGHFDDLAARLQQRLAPSLPGVVVGAGAVSLTVYVPAGARVPRGLIPRKIDGDINVDVVRLAAVRPA